MVDKQRLTLHGLSSCFLGHFLGSSCPLLLLGENIMSVSATSCFVEDVSRNWDCHNPLIRYRNKIFPPFFISFPLKLEPILRYQSTSLILRSIQVILNDHGRLLLQYWRVLNNLYQLPNLGNIHIRSIYFVCMPSWLI